MPGSDWTWISVGKLCASGFQSYSGGRSRNFFARDWQELVWWKHLPCLSTILWTSHNDYLHLALVHASVGQEEAESCVTPRASNKGSAIRPVVLGVRKQNFELVSFSRGGCKCSGRVTRGVSSRGSGVPLFVISDQEPLLCSRSGTRRWNCATRGVIYLWSKAQSSIRFSRKHLFLSLWLLSGISSSKNLLFSLQKSQIICKMDSRNLGFKVEKLSYLICLVLK